MPPPPKIRVRPTAPALVRRCGENHIDRSLTDVATALLQIGERHAAAELAAELAAMPPARPEQDPETGMFKKSTVGP